MFQRRSICDRNTSIGAKAYNNIYLTAIGFSPGGYEALNRSNVFRLHCRFRDGRELVEDGGRPQSTRTGINIAAVTDLVKNDRRIASRMIAESLNVPEKTVVLLILDVD